MIGIFKKTVKEEEIEKIGIVDVKIEKIVKIVKMKEILKNIVIEEERGGKICMKRRIIIGYLKED